jgi:[pyruvate, water dikinase]-phosphate phosphotransferase / [pyruvate, water dikinase] kinase
MGRTESAQICKRNSGKSIEIFSVFTIFDQKEIMYDDNKMPPIYIVSGGKGVAGHTIVETMLIQYPDNKIPIIMEPEVLTAERVEEITNRVAETRGAVVHTMVDHKIRRLVVEACEHKNIPHFDLVGGLAEYLDQTLDIRPVEQPGLFRLRNIEYFRRVRAIEFTMAHDDGQNVSKIENADVVLTGVSRTGKTPLSIYLAMFGWKVANVPIVPGIPPPESLFTVDPRRVFGLDISIIYLIAQRANRVIRMNMSDDSDYIDRRKVRDELDYAKRTFLKGGFTILNVTNKPIEYTANQVVTMVTDRFGADKWQRDEV